MKNILELTDEELESCIDGSTDLSLIRKILKYKTVIDLEGWIDPEAFADFFAHSLEGFISADEDTDEWTEANEVNWTWGYDIADNINSYASDNFKSNE